MSEVEAQAKTAGGSVRVTDSPNEALTAQKWYTRKAGAAKCFTARRKRTLQSARPIVQSGLLTKRKCS
jgi:hypothetical protein